MGVRDHTFVVVAVECVNRFAVKGVSTFAVKSRTPLQLSARGAYVTLGHRRHTCTDSKDNGVTTLRFKVSSPLR